MKSPKCYSIKGQFEPVLVIPLGDCAIINNRALDGMGSKRHILFKIYLDFNPDASILHVWGHHVIFEYMSTVCNEQLIC